MDKEIKEQLNKPKMRQLIIETDGTIINVVKAEVASNLEFIAILQALMNKVAQQGLKEASQKGAKETSQIIKPD